MHKETGQDNFLTIYVIRTIVGLVGLEERMYGFTIILSCYSRCLVSGIVSGKIFSLKSGSIYGIMTKITFRLLPLLQTNACGIFVPHTLIMQEYSFFS